MRKLFTLALAALTATTLGVSTANAAPAEDITGEWFLTSMTEGEEVYDASLLSMFGMEASMTLNADGSAEMVFSTEEPEAGSWTMEGTTGTVTIEEKPATMTLVDGQLRIDVEDGAFMLFGRERATSGAPEIGAVIEDPALEDFNGEWSGKYTNLMGMVFPLDMLGEELTLSIQDGTITYTSVSPAIRVDDPVEEETMAEEETVEAEMEDEAPEMEIKTYTMTAELVNGALTVTGNAENGYTNLSLKLHENGFLTDGYTEEAEAADTNIEPEEEEDSEDEVYENDDDLEEDKEEEAEASFTMYTIFERAE